MIVSYEVRGEAKPRWHLLSRSDYELLSALTWRCRCLSSGQCGRVLDASESAIRGRLKALEVAGLIERFPMMIHPELPLTAPVLDWSPDRSGVPDFGAISWQLKSRWKESPKQERLIVGTAKAQKLTGGGCGGRRPRVREATHDVHVASVYLWYREHESALAPRFLPEDRLRAGGNWGPGAIPDAIIQSGSGLQKENIVIDFGGSYSKRKLEKIHDEYSRCCRYQIW